MPPASLRAVLPWIAAPLAVMFAVLFWFWYDAPVMDDYDSILGSLVILAKAQTFPEWLRALVALHNEHRAATTRLIPQLFVWATGHVDFRFLMLFGPLYIVGALAFVWAEFRGSVAPAILGAGAFLGLQWSYSEALLHSSGALPHLGVVFFSVSGLYFALRPGWASAVACAALGVLAAFSQANGLVMLPIAAVGCLVAGLRLRGVALAILAAAVWTVYFTGYMHPVAHPPITTAFTNPVNTVRLFLINVGGIATSLDLSQMGGAVLLGAVAWVTWKGLWRRHPTAFLWMAFVLGSAASVTLGRAGWGLFRADRYAVYPALLMPILLFSVYSLTGPWSRRLQWSTFGVAALLSLTLTATSLPRVRDMSVKGHLLTDLGESGPRFGLSRRVGALYPNPTHPYGILDNAERIGLYAAKRSTLRPATVVTAPSKPSQARRMGEIHVASVSGKTVTYQAWTDVPATLDRKLTLYPPDGVVSAAVNHLQLREDAALSLRKPEVLLGGFFLVVEFATEAQANSGAQGLCVFVDAPGYTTAVLPQPGGGGCR